MFMVSVYVTKRQFLHSKICKQNVVTMERLDVSPFTLISLTAISISIRCVRRSLTFASCAAVTLLHLVGGFTVSRGSRQFNPAHVHPAALAVRAVGFTLITFLKVLHALNVV